MGLATGRALARSGSRVTVLEQYGPGHARGSSHGTSRIFKLSYPEAEFVRLAQASLARWRELEDESGEELLTATGSIDAGGLAGRREALEECGVDFDFLDPPEVARRFGLAVDGDGPALYQAEGGVLHADRILTALGAGLEVRYGTEVQRLAVDGDGVLLQTPAGDVRAQAVVVAAGPWVRRLVEPLGIEPDVVPVRETVAYLPPPAARPLPTLSEWRLEEKQVMYGLVARDGLLKVGVSGSGKPDDPDGPGTVDPDVVRRATAWAARSFGLADDTPVRAETCTYTNKPDERFILERHGRVVVGSACSGHGFKFAPVVGERLAELALEAAAS